MLQADQQPVQQQPSSMQSSEATPATVAASNQASAAARKPKQPIKFVAPPPKTSPRNPNFTPRQAWPDGKYIKILPGRQLPPGQHRWKGSIGAGPHPGQRQLASRPGGGGGSVNMHSAIALDLQSAGNGGGGGRVFNSNGHSAFACNGRAAAGGMDHVPEPGEVPAAARRRISYQPGADNSANGYNAAPASSSRPLLLADMYARQIGAGGRGLTGSGEFGSGGSPVDGASRQRQRQGATSQHLAGRSFEGPSSGGGGTSDFGGGSGAANPFRRPSGHNTHYAEGYKEAEKTIAAAADNQWSLANSRAALIAHMKAGDERDSARAGFRSRIKQSQRQAEESGDAAFVAELEEFLQVALGAGAADTTRSGSGGGAAAVADAVDSFSFRANGSGAFGSSVSVERGAGTGPGWGGGSGGLRGRAIFRKGSREVQVGDGGGSGGYGGGGGGFGGGGGAVDGFSGHKRKAPWQAPGGGTTAAGYRKVDAIPAGSYGSGGNPKFIKPKFGKAAPGKPAASKAAPAAKQAPYKKPAAAAAQPPPSIGQKLGMSLDAIAGKLAAKSSAAKPAAAGVVSAAPGGSGKHRPIAWQG